MSDLVGLVSEFLSRGSHESPVLVLTGSRGCGKTAAVRSLVPELDQQVPYALIDCATVTTGTRELLSTLAFELNYQSGAYGRLSFPRLVTGLLVIPLKLDQHDPKRAGEQVRLVLEGYRQIDRLREFISGMAASAIKVLPPARNAPGVDVVARYGADLLMDGLVAGRISRKVVLGPGQEWYGHQDRGLARNPLDVLVDLNRRASRLEAGSNERLVAELLWAAFLADLHANFARASGWDLNCAVLLDNADAPAGLQFLDELSRARAVRRAANPRDAPDPLTVVATSRGTIPARVLAADAIAAPLRDANYAGYEQLRDDGQVEAGWYPVCLPDLTEAEIGNLVASLELHGVTDERMSPVISGFTSGHPGATYKIVEALSGSADPADLSGVLAALEPPVLSGERLPVGQRMLRSLIGGLGTAAVKDLMTCTVARDLEDASALATRSGLLTGPRSAQRDIFAAELWVRQESGPVVMLPVLRRLLLRRLEANPAAWRSAYEWLKKETVKEDDIEGELYYSLALGEVEQVARRMAVRLTEVSATEWLALLETVTAAPGAPSQPDITELVAWADPRDMPFAAVGAHVAALWLLTNSLNAHHRQELHTEAAASLEDVAPYAGAGRMTLRAKAQKYERLAAAS